MVGNFLSESTNFQLLNHNQMSSFILITSWFHATSKKRRQHSTSLFNSHFFSHTFYCAVFYFTSNLKFQICSKSLLVMHGFC